MCIAAFMDAWQLTAVLCFFVSLGYFALNETARELEHPYGLGANHLCAAVQPRLAQRRAKLARGTLTRCPPLLFARPLLAFQDELNSKLARMLDVRIPNRGRYVGLYK